jgi:UDP-N-acetylmuramyl pentapeptide phosphotransferase/UDP-N-acetylglucosamine-1-phosphate transferase
MVFIINSYNFIDGIDGLASLLGILIFLSFITIFYNILINTYIYFICIVILGSLLSFIYFNLFKINMRIFMGNSGSMLIGFLISLVALYILKNSKIINTLIIVISNLFVIIIDAIAVLLTRMINRKSVFQSDNNHIHYKMERLGLSHREISFIITIFNVLIILLILYIQNLNINFLLFILANISIILYCFFN